MENIRPVTLLVVVMMGAATFGANVGQPRFSKTGGHMSVKGDATVDGVTCHYAETGNSGGGPRGIRIYGCNYISVPNVECTYYGANPHHCGNAYNKNHAAYYRALAIDAMENGQPCSKPNITETICDLSYPCTAGHCSP